MGFQLQGSNVVPISEDSCWQYRHTVFVLTSHLPEKPSWDHKHASLLLGKFWEVIWSWGWYHLFHWLSQHSELDSLLNLPNLSTNPSSFMWTMPITFPNLSSGVCFLCVNCEYLQILSGNPVSTQAHEVSGPSSLSLFSISFSLVPSPYL